MTHFRDGHWYRSRAAIDLAASLRPTGDPHRTPDGCAVLVYDARGFARQPTVDGKSALSYRPPALVMQATDGRDLMAVEGTDRIVRVEFPPEALADAEPLVEYDHLPEARKDPSVYARGHKLA